MAAFILGKAIKSTLICKEVTNAHFHERKLLFYNEKIQLHYGVGMSVFLENPYF